MRLWLSDDCGTFRNDLRQVEILSFIIGILIGVAVGIAIFFVLRSKWKEKNGMFSEEIERLRGNLKTSTGQLILMQRENTELTGRASSLQTKVESLDSQLAAERESHRLHAEKMEEDLRNRLEEERAHSKELREESDRQWNEKFEAMRQEMQRAAAEQLAQRQSSLQETNRQQLDELLKPVKEQFEAFKKSVDASRTSSEVNKTELKETFVHLMDSFEKVQREAVSSLREQTERIGNDAVNLTKALKGENKTQGDWGEMVLETLLEASGLHKDEEYFVQQNVKDDAGNNLRPDVVVKFPEGRSVVIDSKVSLTAYANAVAAEADEEREQYLKEHVKSMQKHVDELAGKNYDKMLGQSIGFVLMFVPNENSYIAAMKQNPDLGRYAYKKNIIIISPSNLQITLLIAYNLWQIDRQSRNVEKIVKSATDLYDKVAGMSETFEDIGNQITRLNDTYQKAHSQLYTGKGNVMNRLEGLRKMGISPKKQIKGKVEED